MGVYVGGCWGVGTLKLCGRWVFGLSSRSRSRLSCVRVWGFGCGSLPCSVMDC